MKTQESHYDVLGVAKDADKAAIRRAYLKAVRKHHPDVNPGADPQTFIDISTAYEVLYDDATRKSYDFSMGKASKPCSAAAPESGFTAEADGVVFPTRTHLYAEAAIPADPRPRWILLAAGGLTGVLGFWLAATGVEPIGNVGLASHILNVWVLTGLTFIVMLISWIVTAFAAVTHQTSQASAVTATAMTGLGLVAASMRDAVTMQYWTAASLIAVSAGCLLAAYFIPSKRGTRAGSAEIFPDILEYPIFGEPGDGEDQTAGLLHALTELDGLHVFHSMRPDPYEDGPGSVGHAIMYGQTIILIDTCHGDDGRYSFGDAETIIEQSGADVHLRSTSLAQSLDLYRQAFPSYSVVAWIVIQAGDAEADNRKAPTGMRLAAADDAAAEIVTHLSNVTDETVISSAVDMTVMNRLHA